MIRTLSSGNLRENPRKVRPKEYTVTHNLKSSHHMSQKQCEAVIAEFTNTLFSRRWKRYDDTLPTDADTLPVEPSTRRREP